MGHQGIDRAYPEEKGFLKLHALYLDEKYEGRGYVKQGKIKRTRIRGPFWNYLNFDPLFFLIIGEDKMIIIGASPQDFIKII